jgi:hypothetical protein
LYDLVLELLELLLEGFDDELLLYERELLELLLDDGLLVLEELDELLFEVLDDEL